MPGFKEIFAAKLKQMAANRAAAAEAAQAGVPQEHLESYKSLKQMAATGRFPGDVQEAASLLAAAAEISRAQGHKPVTLGGTKDLPWPPGEAFKTPLGYAPYLPRWKEVLTQLFPQRATAAAPKPAPVQPPDAQDPMAAMRAMAKSADIKGEAKPIATEALATSAVPETDEPEP